MEDSTTSSKPFRVRLLISGLVQGVGYRYSTVRQAQKYGIKGWVRNLDDGRVEAWLEGDRAAVDRVVQWCHQGPPGAKVREVRLIDESLSSQPIMTTFEVRRD
ncbi:acylphosphatase [Oscillatoria sp. FACHB-1406]|uniref:acylphosphatase n=1 Tax=Oscillatoria sp. FACHB-1406 TaxID=2692846 RepID=UPI001688461F|nr:acylphosphatase [Oscillatoria sp. FACHB-1406]MBD2578561.1 acylphosphatase [Oscillatoria sp. FACHB-1406]